MWDKVTFWLLALGYSVDNIDAVCTGNINGYGDFIFHGGTFTSCTVTIAKWAGVTVSVPLTNFGGTITRTQSTLGVFSYGLTYQFTFDSSNCGGCDSASVSVTPTLCSNTVSENSYMSPVIQPALKMLPVVRNSPTGSYCVFLVVDSSDPTGMRTESSAGDCSIPSLMSLPTFSTSKTWYVNMVRYSSSPTMASSVPTCGVSEASVSTLICSDTPSFSLASWTSLGVKIQTTPSANFKCLAVLTKWNNNALSNAVSKLTNGCTSVVFGAQDTGTAFSDSPDYIVQYYRYANNKDVNVDNPDCVAVDTTQSATLQPTTASLLAADLTVTRPDPATIRVTIASSKAYTFGTCEVRLTSSSDTDDVPSVPVSRYGPCGSNFDFVIDGTNIVSWTNANVLEFVYLFYYTGDILSTTASVGPSTALSYNVPSFSCPTITVTENPTGIYTIKTGSPVPATGGCALDFGGSAPINWPGCDQIQINYYDMFKIDNNIDKPGNSFTFELKYYTDGYSVGATSVCSSATVSKTVYLNYGLVLDSATSSSFTFILGSSTTPPSGDPNYYTTNAKSSVTFSLYACNAAAPGSPAQATETITSSFGDPITFTNGVNSAVIPPGATCFFDVQVTATGDTATYSGYSGMLSFVAAAPPSWTGLAPPRVLLYGSDCVRLVWTKVSDPINAPITCYLILQASGSSSANAASATPSVVRACSNPNALVADFTFCSLSSSLYYEFTIEAINSQGSDDSSTGIFKLSDLQADSTLVYAVTVDSTSNKFSAGTFPTLSIEWPPSVTPPTDLFIPRLLIGMLINKATLDTSTKTIPNYASSNGIMVGPLVQNQVFPFVDTYTFRASGTGPTAYMYDLLVQPATVTIAGEYSVVTYAVQGGGLLGQYWTNTVFSGTVNTERVDPELNFDWGTGAAFTYTSGGVTTRVYDMFSVRWTGFIEAAYSELYTFYIDTRDQVMVWIDNVPVISEWSNSGPCTGVCTGHHQLVQSILTSTSNVGERKFHYIRIDLVHARGVNLAEPALIKLYWSSNSQAKEIIPSERLFTGYPITGTTGSASPALPTVDIEPGALNVAATSVTVTATEIVAGETFYMNITTKDVYGNIVQTNNEQFKVAFTCGASAVTEYSIVDQISLGKYFIPLSCSSLGTLTLAVTRITGGATDAVTSIIVTITAGPITSLTIGTIPSIVAGNSFSLPFTLKDANSNEVTITSAMDLSGIAITATWTGNTALSSVTPDDTAARIQRFSTTFNPTAITPSIGTSVVTATMSLPFSGDYTINYVFGDNSPGSSTTSVAANTGHISGEYSVVTTAPFPPSQWVTHESQSIVIQLRDIYMNPITTNIAPTVVYKIGTSTAVACTNGGTGTFTCAISPTVVGDNLPLSITVDGDHVCYLENGDSVRRIQSPWLIDVLPAAYDATKSTVLGLQFSYTVGVQYEITIILNDAYNNPVGAAPSTCPTIGLSFDSVAVTTVSTTCNNDGTITYVFKPMTADTSASMDLTVDGSPIASNIPTSLSTAIGVLKNFASATGSTCTITSTTGTYTAGSSADVSCTPKDVGSNSALEPGYALYVAMHLRLQTDPSVLISSELALTGSDYVDSTTLIATVAGSYDYYIELAQPGGLMAQYYEFDDFTQVIGTSSGIVAETLFPGDPELRYTRIDPSINFDWSNDGVSIAGVSATAIQWSGYIYFPTGAASCTLAGNGEVHFELDGSVLFDNFGTTGTFTPAAFTVTAATRYSILLKFKPTATNPTLSLKYSTTATAVWIVPPVYFSAPLPIPSSQITGHYAAFTFNAAAITSSTTLITFPYNIIAGQPATFNYYPQDAYGNSLTITSCTSITFSLKDSTGWTVPDATAFANPAPGGSDNKVTCNSGLTAITGSSGFVGSIKINIEATDYSIVATVVHSGGNFNLQIDHVDITSPP